MTPEQVSKEIDDFTKDLIKKVKRAEVIALKSLEGDYKQRIFNNTEASDGTSLGKYKSRSHIKKRRSKGRQVGRKDLQLEGDLIRSIQVGTSRGKNVMGFFSTKARLIAEGQEGQIKKEIWTPQDDELNRFFKAYTREL